LIFNYRSFNVKLQQHTDIEAIVLNVTIVLVGDREIQTHWC